MKLTGDETAAEALRVAERWLIKQGWKFSPDDVGKRAAEILKALRENDAGLEDTTHGE